MLLLTIQRVHGLSRVMACALTYEAGKTPSSENEPCDGAWRHGHNKRNFYACARTMHNELRMRKT